MAISSSDSSAAGVESKGFIAALESDQVVHVESLLKILSRFPYAIDTTLMGGGKSFAAAAVAEHLKFETVVIVCPASIDSQWRTLLERPEYKIDSLTTKIILSYESLRSERAVTKHGLLSKKESEFAPTPKLVEMCKNGTLFIFDEAHRVKNDVLTTKAVSTITKLVVQAFDRDSALAKTRCMLLSGTLYDQPSHAITLMVTLGIMGSREVCRTDRSLRIAKLTGGAELINFVKRRIRNLSADAPDPDLGQTGVTCSAEAEEFVLSVVSEHILPVISSSMVLESEITSASDDAPDDAERDARTARVRSIDCVNLIACLKRTEREGYTIPASELPSVSHASGIKRLADAAGYGTTNKINLGAFMRAIRELEVAKAPTVARLATNAVRGNEKSKIIIVVKYRTSLKIIEQLMRERLPELSAIEGCITVVSGSTSPAERMVVFTEFQKPTPAVRVIIASLDIIALGVNLDDLTGEWPRTMFAMPSFYAINMHQLVRRIYRRYTVGKATVRIVYGAASSSVNGLCGREDLIMKSGRRKASNIRGTMHESAARKILFADRYPIVDEDGNSLAAIAEESISRKTSTRPRYVKAPHREKSPAAATTTTSKPAVLDLGYLFGVRSV